MSKASFLCVFLGFILQITKNKKIDSKQSFSRNMFKNLAIFFMKLNRMTIYTDVSMYRKRKVLNSLVKKCL